MLAMTGHAKKLSDLGIVIPNRLGINRVLQSLPPSYKNFVMNYNMQNMNKELPELFGMLKAAEIEIKKEHQVKLGKLEACTVAKSSTESEYIAASEASSEAVWMKRFIVELGVVPSALDPLIIYCDNMGAIANAQEPRSHKRLKHIKLRYHSIREYIEDGEERTQTEELLAKISRNHDDWTTPEPTPTPILKKRGMIKLNDEDMREAKKSLKEKGILDDFFTLVNKAGLTTYVGDEREQYYMLTKIFVESFKFNNTQYEPTVAFKIYGNPVTMELEDFCRALDIAPVGTARRIDDNPRDLLELYRGITDDDCRTIQRGKIRNIQLPAIKYFAYYIATSILGRENTSNISSYHLAFLNIALTGRTSYHLGSLIARRLSNKGPIFGGTIALRVLTYLRLPLDPNDVPLAPRKLDIVAMKSHHFVTADSTVDNMVYRMLFSDGDEKEIPLPQPGLFSIDRQSWSCTKEEVDEHMKIQDFHQQHDSEDAEASHDYTVTYPGASSSTYPEYDPSLSYYGDITSWDRWD
ncbi:hypothetical protein QYE76_057314 [Lolium multiflorum]|uniref:Arabidopsis retrotransposon Orf1 C-terminal domain-containing protein n=1 Tax=Lolium multiflorum TaxID=4521 RepID=A0AAD8T468_LOLMU|nr:hypothetical protein QYE76_057314 [Lolium multiflorum]